MRLFRKRLADGERLDLDGLGVRLRVNPRARRVSLRVDPVKGEVVATAPSLSRLIDAADFARARRAWVARRLAARPAITPLAAGDTVLVFGAPCVLEPTGRRPRWLDADTGRRLTGCGAGEVDPQLVARAIRAQAHAVFAARAAVHCAALLVPLPPISVTDPRGRWGSCTPAGPARAASIRLSWRLALAPFAVADYVVAHECAHLREANHGPRFWAHVHALTGDPRQERAWLRTHGAQLHAFGR